MYIDRFVPDDEHTELAWLTTRGLWGDLQDDLTDDHAAAAQELSRSLRRRLALTQPSTLRTVAVVSRLSLKHPFSPDDTPIGGRRRPLRTRRSKGSFGRIRRGRGEETIDVAPA
jgi:hypothetical protein